MVMRQELSCFEEKVVPLIPLSFPICGGDIASKMSLLLLVMASGTDWMRGHILFFDPDGFLSL